MPWKTRFSSPPDLLEKASAMNTVRSLILAALGLLIVACPHPAAYAGFAPPPVPLVQKRLDRIRVGEINGDRSVIPDIIAFLDYPSRFLPEPNRPQEDVLSRVDPYFIEPVLRAAVRLQATEALPQIERLIKNPNTDGYSRESSDLARVIRARLRADHSAQSITDPKAQAAKRISVFYAEVGLTPVQINTALQEYNQPELNAAGQPVILLDYVKPTPRGVYALREIADMMYVNGAQDYLTLPAVKTLHFAEGGGLPLMIHLGRPTRAARLGAMMNYLSHSPPDPSGYVVRLAIEEGPAAAQAAADKIKQMEANRALYPRNGFSNLIDVVNGAGDRAEGTRLEAELEQLLK